MKVWLNENWGGTILVTAGVVRGLALYWNGAFRRTPFYRLGGCLVGAGFWIAMTMAMVTSIMDHEEIPVPAMLAVSCVMFGAEFYSALRCGSDASYLDSFGNRVPVRGNGARHST